MPTHDVIVVGARCSGSPVAMLLAQKGHKVLLVDKSTFPSDMPLSTHWAHQPAIDRMRKWGLLGELVATGCPPIGVYNWDIGPFKISGSPRPYGETSVSYAPRRKVLDDILLRGAVRAGVEVQEGVDVEGLITDAAGRVAGIRGRTRSGNVVEERAALVVGADGTESRIAEWVGAPSYNEVPARNGQLFTYWSGVPFDGVEFWPSAGKAAFGFGTNDGLTLIAAAWSIDQFPAARAAGEAAYREAIGEVAPALRERLQSGRREAGFIAAAVRGFYRKPYGPGWALAGDAGYTKDPCTASGITDAFRDTETLADAIDSGLSGRSPMEDALAAYEKQRNETTMAHYQFTSMLAALEPPPPEMQQIMFACSQNADAASQLFGVVAQTVTEQEFFDPANVGRILGQTGPSGN